MRKSFFILVMLAGFYSASFAQFDAGQIVVGGSISFSSSTTKSTVNDVTSTSDPRVIFNFSPRGGYFLSEDLELGLRIGYNSNKTGDPDSKIVSTAVWVGPYARKYFELGDNIYVYGQGSIGTGWGKTKATGGGTTVKTDDYNSFGIAVSPGVMYRAGDRVALEVGLGSLGYSSYTNKNLGGGDKSTTNEFNFDIDLTSINFGINVFL